MDRAKKIEMNRAILEIKGKLSVTDYVTDKLTAAIVEYVVTDDKSKVLALYEEYQSTLAQRDTYRAQINALQEELKQMSQRSYEQN